MKAQSEPIKTYVRLKPTEGESMLSSNQKAVFVETKDHEPFEYSNFFITKMKSSMTNAITKKFTLQS